MTIAIDFDGTIVEHNYPAIGKEKPFAIETLLELSSQGHKLILWTARDGELLEDALKFCRDRGLEFFAVNSNYPAGSLFADKSDKSNKVIADIYIDDKNLGGLPDWGTIYEMITKEPRRRHRRESLWGKLFKKHRRRK